MAKLHLGTIGWSYSFWKSVFYPDKTPAKDFLKYYSTQFSTVEVDSTFYRTPPEQTVRKWHDQTPPNFRFAAKFPQRITHIKRLKEAQADTDLFLSRIQLLGDKLGPLLLQFPPNFNISHFSELETYLKSLPKSNRYVVEVRNKSWLTSHFYDLLRSQRVALAWTDSPRMEPTEEVTADFLYIRWEGNRKAVNGTLGKVEKNRDDDLAKWAQQLKLYLKQGLEVYGYFGKYFSGYPPLDASTLQGLATS